MLECTDFVQPEDQVLRKHAYAETVESNDSQELLALRVYSIIADRLTSSYLPIYATIYLRRLTFLVTHKTHEKEME